MQVLDPLGIIDPHNTVFNFPNNDHQLEFWQKSKILESDFDQILDPLVTLDIYMDCCN